MSAVGDARKRLAAAHDAGTDVVALALSMARLRNPDDVPTPSEFVAAAAVLRSDWLAAHDAALFAAAEARGAAEALNATADAWQRGEWVVLTPKIKAATQPQRIIGAAQAVTDWLRARTAPATDRTEAATDA